MHAAALGAAPTTWARHSHTFPRKLPLGLVVKGVAARSELGEVTHHWLVVTGFERGQVLRDGASLVASRLSFISLSLPTFF